jgi:hypothetical protein
MDWKNCCRDDDIAITAESWGGMMKDLLKQAITEFASEKNYDKEAAQVLKQTKARAAAKMGMGTPSRLKPHQKARK